MKSTGNNHTESGKELQLKAAIIDDFVSGIQVKDICEKHNTHFEFVYDTVKAYYPVKDGTIITLGSIATASNKWIISHFWNTKSIKEIAEILGVSSTAVQNNALRMGLPRKVKVPKKPTKWGNSKASIYLNIENGIYYFSRSEVALAINVTENYLRRHLEKTSFIYLGKYNRKVKRLNLV